jgi:hypothetical protein
MWLVNRHALLAVYLGLVALPARAQSFRVQCPATTALHPNGSAVDPAHPGVVKCQHVGGGDGFATMGDGTQIYLFAFSPLSGLADIQAGLPGTETADVFNAGYHGPNYSTAGVGVCTGGTNPLAPTEAACNTVADCPDPVGTMNAPAACDASGSTPNWAATPDRGAITDPAGIMDMGVLAGNAPAPLIAIDEDDELFLTLSNPGMIMRPDLFEQHTVHFHGYPNASSFFDGVPDASIAINIAGSFTYYYTAPDAGTYFWHCHITPPEHLQMGMVGQLYVRPRQNRLTSSDSLHAALVAAKAGPSRASTMSPTLARVTRSASFHRSNAAPFSSHPPTYAGPPRTSGRRITRRRQPPVASMCLETRTATVGKLPRDVGPREMKPGRAQQDPLPQS